MAHRSSVTLAVLVAAALLVACDAVTRPPGPESEHTAETPLASIGLVDTVQASPGVAVEVTVAAEYTGTAAFDTLQVLARPMAGEVVARSLRTLEYTPAEDAFGEDVLSYELVGAGRTTVFGTVVFQISATPGRVAGISILRQAAIPGVELPDRIRYRAVDLTDPRIVALRPLVSEILAGYPPALSALDAARVLRDWMARTAVHPYPPLHPDGSSANLAVLPVGVTWAEVNALYHDRLAGDSNYWTQLYQDGPQMLDRLLGTQAPGNPPEDGMMERIGPGRYRIRSLDSYRFVLCSYQSQMLIALWAAAGLQGMMVPTVGHDASAVFIADLGKWVYMDPTYDEEYVLAGSDTPLSPLELVTVSTAGRASALVSRNSTLPHWDTVAYIAAAADPASSYVGEHPAGFVLIGSQLNNTVTSPFGVPVLNVQLDNAALAADPFFGNPGNFARVMPSVAFPELGVGIARIEAAPGGALVHLASSVPGHVRFQRRVPGGEWSDCTASDFVSRGAGRIAYRSLDATGASGMTALIEG
jgi:hypothetical protein